MNWIVSNWAGICLVAVAVLAVAKGVAKLTATPKDDEIVEKIEEVVEPFIKPKDKP